MLDPILGSLLASALQGIFGIGSTMAANKYNSPRAQRNRLKKAGLPLAYMYQGKVMGQSDVPKLSIDPTLGVTQQRKLEQDQPMVDANVKMKGQIVGGMRIKPLQPRIAPKEKPTFTEANFDAALKAKATIIKKHGEGFYSKIGTAGGKKKTTGGFASMDKERLSEVSAKGGRISRKKIKNNV